MTATDTVNPITQAIRPITIAIRVESALGDLLTHLQDNPTADIDYAELLSRLHYVVSRTADVVGEVCDRIEPLPGALWADAHEHTADALRHLQTATAHLDTAADSADESPDA